MKKCSSDYYVFMQTVIGDFSLLPFAFSGNFKKTVCLAPTVEKDQPSTLLNDENERKPRLFIKHLTCESSSLFSTKAKAETCSMTGFSSQHRAACPKLGFMFQSLNLVSPLYLWLCIRGHDSLSLEVFKNASPGNQVKRLLDVVAAKNAQVAF